MWQSIREYILRAAGLFSKNRRDRELSEELEFHLALQTARYQEAGGSSSRACHEANRKFGGLERWKERCRDTATLRPLEDFHRDLRLALRVLSPIFTCVAAVTLAAAISANTAIFSLMNAVLLKSVEVPHPDELALLCIHPGNWGYSFNYPWFREIEKESSGMMQVFAFASRDMRLKTIDGAEDVPVQFVSGTYFPTLGGAPALGRYIGPQDDRPGMPGGEAAVISGAFWHSHFGSEEHVLGRTLTINQIPFTIVGVMPDRFRGMDRDEHPDVFIPVESEPLVDAPFNSIAAGYQSWWLHVGARLKEGVGLRQASAFLETNSRSMMHSTKMPANFKFNGYSVQDLCTSAEPGFAGFSFIRFRFAKPVRVLMVLVGLVLLVACLNLATLLVARAATRYREISIRFALGASRSRLVRQLLTECLLLSLAGAAMGLPAALLLTRTLAALIAPHHSITSAQLDARPDLAVFAFTAAITILATLLIGVVPALRSTDRQLQANVRQGSPTLHAPNVRHLWPRMLLVVEITGALILVTGASLLGYSFLKLHEVPLGFNPAGLVHLKIETGSGKLRVASRPELYRNLIDRLKTLSSVSDVSICEVMPFSGAMMMTDVAVPGRGHEGLWANAVGPDYFHTMRIRLREGREFRWTDQGSDGNVAILNLSAAKDLFPGQNALGQFVTNDGGKTLFRIVGIADDAKYSSVRDAAPPTIYFSGISQANNSANFVIFLLRTKGSAAPLVASASRIIHQNLPQIPPPVAITMQDTLNESLGSERILMLLAAFFGVFALVITGIGLYGTLAYMTERRTGEIGIRLALGARPADIAILVCRENGLLACSGCLAGLIASLLFSKLVGSFLFGITPRDPLAFACAVTALLFVAVGASLLPAKKAMQIDPVAAIRHE